MGIFSSDDQKTREPEPGDHDWPGHQDAVAELWDALAEHDARGLTRLSPEEHRRQHEARWALYAYIDEIWEDAKQQGLNPAMRPEWQAVAAIRDLASFLASAARDVDTD